VRRLVAIVAVLALGLAAAGALPGVAAAQRVLVVRHPPMRGADVLDAQLYLRYLGLLRVRASGTYGPRSAAAVRRFQRLHRMRRDGALGPRTWRTLRRAIRIRARLVAPTRGRPAARPGMPLAPGPRPLLRLTRPRERSGDVLTLQRALTRVGVFHVRPTGLFGRITYRAVRAYQRLRGIRVDGIVGPTTWATLSGITASAQSRANLISRLDAPGTRDRVGFTGCAADDMARERAGQGTIPSSDADPPPPGQRTPRHVSTTMMRQWLALADAGFSFQVGSLISCHSWHAHEEDGTLSGRVSKHPLGLAYDVTAVDGQVVTPAFQRTQEFAAFVGALAALPGSLLPGRIISLVDADGPDRPVSIVQTNHGDHVHVEIATPGA
jgi:peptidoglycan hydrolase-like protein with peptidoglycan-binding domain